MREGGRSGGVHACGDAAGGRCAAAVLCAARRFRRAAWRSAQSAHPDAGAPAGLQRRLPPPGRRQAAHLPPQVRGRPAPAPWPTLGSRPDLRPAWRPGPDAARPYALVVGIWHLNWSPLGGSGTPGRNPGAGGRLTLRSSFLGRCRLDCLPAACLAWLRGLHRSQTNEWAALLRI